MGGRKYHSQHYFRFSVLMSGCSFFLSFNLSNFYCFIDWLIILYRFTSVRSRIFHLYGDVTIADEGLQNLGLCSALRAFEQEGIFIVPHQLWHGTSGFPFSSEGPSPFSRLLRHTRVTRILSGFLLFEIQGLCNLKT
jgi:hypothetical protein